MILTIIILVLFHVGRKMHQPHSMGKKMDPGGFHQRGRKVPGETDRKEEGLIVLRETCSSVKESAWRSQSVKNIQQVRLICQPGNDNRWMGRIRDVWYGTSSSIGILV